MNKLDIYIYSLMEELEILDEGTGTIGKILGKKQYDKRDPGEVLAFNRKHSLFGNVMGTVVKSNIFSFINSHSKSSDPSSLYPKYLKWCAKNNVEPSSKEQFIKISKAYHKERKLDKAISTGADIATTALATKGLGNSTISRAIEGGSRVGDVMRSSGRNERVLNSLKEDVDFLIDTVDIPYFDEI